jgi:hypothetical protein
MSKSYVKPYLKTSKPTRPERPVSAVPQIKIHRLIEKAVWERTKISPENLQRMVAQSVRCTHPDGNRRYANYLFTIEGNILYSVKRIKEITDDVVTMEIADPVVKEDIERGSRSLADLFEAMTYKQKALPALVQKGQNPMKAVEPIINPCEHCDGMGVIGVFNPCEHCDGSTSGCAHCDAGMVATSIICSVCKGKKHKPKEFKP